MGLDPTSSFLDRPSSDLTDLWRIATVELADPAHVRINGLLVESTAPVGSTPATASSG